MTNPFCLMRFGQIDLPAPQNPRNDNGLEPVGLVGGSGGSRGIGLWRPLKKRRLMGGGYFLTSTNGREVAPRAGLVPEVLAHFMPIVLKSSASKSASKTGDLTREELGLDWGWRHRNGFTVRPESLIWLLRQSGPKRGWIPASGTIFKRKHPENTSVCAIQRFLLNSCASKSASKRTWRAHGRPSEVRKNRER